MDFNGFPTSLSRDFVTCYGQYMALVRLTNRSNYVKSRANHSVPLMNIKSLDCLKKKPVKLCRKILASRLMRTPQNRVFESFLFVQLPDEEIRQMVESANWPASEWRPRPSAPFRSFSRSCIRGLFTMQSSKFYYLYLELIEYLFHSASELELLRFLGRTQLSGQERLAFEYYFLHTLPSKCWVRPLSYI